jgi:hypothetical protein
LSQAVILNTFMRINSENLAANYPLLSDEIRCKLAIHIIEETIRLLREWQARVMEYEKKLTGDY